MNHFKWFCMHTSNNFEVILHFFEKVKLIYKLKSLKVMNFSKVFCLRFTSLYTFSSLLCFSIINIKYDNPWASKNSIRVWEKKNHLTLAHDQCLHCLRSDTIRLLLHEVRICSSVLLSWAKYTVHVGWAQSTYNLSLGTPQWRSLIQEIKSECKTTRWSGSICLHCMYHCMNAHIVDIW